MKKDIVQIKNPRSGKYIKIDRGQGRIYGQKKSLGPYKGIPITRRKRNSSEDKVGTKFSSNDA